MVREQSLHPPSVNPGARLASGRAVAIALLVGAAAGALGYAFARLLGCSTTCVTGTSPWTFGLLLAVTAGLATASGLSSLSRHKR